MQRGEGDFMKSQLNRFLMVTVFVALAAAPRQSEGRVMVMAALDEPTVATLQTQTETSVADTANAPAAGAESQTGNVATATKSRGPAEASANRPNVRVDEKGVHIGGPHPVDIDVPSFKHHGGAGDIDVVGIVGVVFGCTVPIAIVAIIFYFRHRRLKMHHETIRAMIEKGMPIPPEMAAGTRSDHPLGNTDVRPGRNDFRGGLILVAVGSALLMIAGKVGWILVFIGAARLVIWLVEDRNPKV
jgi:hypothetical protein